MATRRELSGDISSVKFPDKKIAFHNDFAKILQDRTKLHSFLKLEKEASHYFHHPEDIFEENGVVVQNIGYVNAAKSEKKEAFYYKVSLQNETFIVKKVPRQYSSEHGGGYQEVVDSEDATALIVNLDKVKLVSYQLGYED